LEVPKGIPYCATEIRQQDLKFSYNNTITNGSEVNRLQDTEEAVEQILWLSILPPSMGI